MLNLRTGVGRPAEPTGKFSMSPFPTAQSRKFSMSPFSWLPQSFASIASALETSKAPGASTASSVTVPSSTIIA